MIPEHFRRGYDLDGLGEALACAQLCFLIINKLLKFGSKIIVMQCALQPQD